MNWIRMGMKKYFVKIKEEKNPIIFKQPVSKIIPFLNNKKKKPYIESTNFGLVLLSCAWDIKHLLLGI